VRRPALLVLLAALGLACGGCGGSGTTTASTKAAAPTSASASKLDVYGCVPAIKPRPKGPQHLKRPTGRLDPGKTWTVTVRTNCGTFAFRLDVKRSPKTSASFASLVRKGFYDGLSFHRIVAGFVIQGGDPLGDGQGGPGYSVVEAPPASLHYTRGTVAMAKTQTEPTGASGSQFFVVTAEDATVSAGLTPDYALLGKVVSGMSTVNRISSIPGNAESGVPDAPVVMRRVTLSSR
jgi:peptidyl-prolyl cis-trans isomerase B (cyclophilin B)